ncbi:MAG: hypothetical protein ACYTFA_12900, partial [Planctomycetota bacterium]
LCISLGEPADGAGEARLEVCRACRDAGSFLAGWLDPQIGLADRNDGTLGVNLRVWTVEAARLQRYTWVEE